MRKGKRRGRERQRWRRGERHTIECAERTEKATRKIENTHGTRCVELRDGKKEKRKKNQDREKKNVFESSKYLSQVTHCHCLLLTKKKNKKGV